MFGSHHWMLTWGVLKQSTLLCSPCSPTCLCPLPSQEVGTPSLSDHCSSLCLTSNPFSPLHSVISLSPLFFTCSLYLYPLYPCVTQSNLSHPLQRCLLAGGSWMWAVQYGSRQTWPATYGRSWRRAVWIAIGQTLLFTLCVSCSDYVWWRVNLHSIGCYFILLVHNISG